MAVFGTLCYGFEVVCRSGVYAGEKEEMAWQKVS
jgi:hypothetical protein